MQSILQYDAFKRATTYRGGSKGCLRRLQGGGIAWTHPDIVNPALLDFLAK
jgi:hypothetical protein